MRKQEISQTHKQENRANMKAVLLDAGKQIMPRADVFAPGKFFYDSDYSRKPYRKQNQQGMWIRLIMLLKLRIAWKARFSSSSPLTYFGKNPS